MIHVQCITYVLERKYLSIFPKVTGNSFSGSESEKLGVKLVTYNTLNLRISRLGLKACDSKAVWTFILFIIQPPREGSLFKR